MTVATQPRAQVGWRTPFIVILCGCTIAMIAFGPRSAFGQFLSPLSQSHGWGRDVFSLAIAIQNLIWGAGQPIAGMIADKYGAPWVLGTGGVLYAVGLVMTAYADTAGALTLSTGLLIGLALSCSSFSLVIGALGKLVPPEHRMLAFGAGTAAGSFGQFLFSPLARVLIDQVGWQNALVTFGAVVLLILPLSLAMATPRADEATGEGAAPTQTAKQALMEALGHRSYNLLVLGFFTCGFQLAFVTVHLPSYLLDRGLSADIGAIAIGAIGLFNIFGSLGAGWLSGRMPKRYVLSGIYITRGVAILAFILLPATPASAITFAAVTGLVWLATVPPTNGLVAVMFGTRWLSMLSGFAFLSHQIGGFLGVWLGGFVFERTGSYDLVWWLSIGFCMMSALVNLPIVEKPVTRGVPVPA
ncbi:MAG TPA: MFS transporter [Xanthobacteraceae bacterium]|nr:MFS transporter [Xanthobacteraceae bacterium]